MDVLLQRLKCWKLPLTPTGFLQRHAQWPQKTGQLTGQKVVHLGIFEDEMTGYHNCFTGSLNYWQSKSTGGKYAPSQALNTTEAHYVYTVHPQLSFTLYFSCLLYIIIIIIIIIGWAGSPKVFHMETFLRIFATCSSCGKQKWRSDCGVGCYKVQTYRRIKPYTLSLRKYKNKK